MHPLFLQLLPKHGVNWAATRLFDRKGFCIYGPAILETSVETWGCLCVLGSEQTVRQNIAYLGLVDHPIVPASRCDTHQDMVARNNYIIMLKLALAR
jgi:hypothetical protein